MSRRPRTSLVLTAFVLGAAAVMPVAPAGAQTRDVLPTTAAGLDSLSVVLWNEYTMLAHSAFLPKSDDVRGFANANAARMGLSAPMVANAEENCFQKRRDKQAKCLRWQAKYFTPRPGEAAYASALTHVRSALKLEPNNAAFQRHFFRLLATKEQWPTLEAEARRVLAAAPRDTARDAQAWLMLGIAAQRQEQYPAAAAAFDSALRLVPPGMRQAYVTPNRLLAPNAAATAQYWDRLDPRPSTRVNEALLEYYARIAYADLLWSTENGYRGIDADRGRVHVRYGPPERMYNIAASVGGTVIWTYSDDAIFYFGRTPGYRATRLADSERRVMEDSMFIVQPAGFSEMPLRRRTWPMLARVARFRSTSPDSADVVIAAAVPVRSLLGDAELGGQLPIDVHVDISDPAARIVGTEKRRVAVTRDNLPIAINGAWIRRLGRGTNVVRAEAEQADVQRGATASVDVQVDSLTGFGMSDLLLGTLPTVDLKAPARWSDTEIKATVGALAAATPLGLVWENYELVTRDGTVKYEVTLELERTFERTIAGFTARIARNLMNVVTQDGSATGRVKLSFVESRPPADVVTNALRINLEGSVTGPYRATISIRDLHTNRIVKRTADFVLTPD